MSHQIFAILISCLFAENQGVTLTTNHKSGRSIGFPRRLKRLFGLGLFRSKH